MATQVPAGDEVAIRVVGEPARPGAHQLVDLVGALPVVLGLIERREQHVELVQRIGEPQRAREREIHVSGITPLRELRVQRDRRRGDVPAERGEQTPGQVRPAATGQDRDLDAQRQRLRGQVGPRGAASAPGGAEDVAEGQGEQGRRGVRAVVDVLRQAGVRGIARAGPGQPHRVDVEQQRRRTALLVSLRVEDHGRAERLPELLDPPRVLVQQKAQVCGGAVGGGNGQQHAEQCASGNGPSASVFRVGSPCRPLTRPERGSVPGGTKPLSGIWGDAQAGWPSSPRRPSAISRALSMCSS